jgi:hypothetical protein
MGRFNWMLRVIRKASAVGLVSACAILGTAGTTLALDANSNMYVNGANLGTIYWYTNYLGPDANCTIRMKHDPKVGTAYVSITDNPPTRTQKAGFTVFDQLQVTSGNDQEISEDFLAMCLGGTVVTNLEQSGADLDVVVADSYANDNVMGFKFVSEGITYEYKIGSGTLPTTNTAPTANAGPDQTSVASAATVTLDGTGSSDPDTDDTLSYTWTQTDSTGLTVTLSSASADKPTFTAPTLNIGDAAATLVFSLIVNDGTVDSTASTVSITVNPETASAANAPTALVATPGDGKITVAFTAPSNDGGATITNYEYSTDGGTSYTAFSPTMTSSPVAITGLINGTSYSIKLRAVNSAGNGAESAAVSVLLGSPASAFEEAEEEIKAIITQDATRSLTSTLSSNQRMTRGARSRFIESRNQGEGDGAGLATRNNVPFDVDGTFDLDGSRLSSKGTFFGQTGNVEGTERRLVFGEFDVQRDGDTGSTTATLTGRVAWEQMISDDTMLGYFVGGELADSNISGAFEGKQTRVAATAGGYAVRALSETLFADGFISIGAGRNNLEMADDVLALTSDYTTRTATVGGALTGVYAYERYELRPEMAFSYGKTWIGDVGFTGVAYGLTDNTLSVDAGTVSTASLTLRPEIVWALDAETVAGSNAQLSFAPRFICERTTTATTTQNCGAGAEIGLSSNSEDGLSSANIRFVMDRVGNSNRSNVVFNVEQRF